MASTRFHSSSGTSTVRSESPLTPAQQTRTSRRPELARRRARPLRRGRPDCVTSPEIARSASAPSALRSKTATFAPPAREPRGRRRADALRPAGDERDAPLEVVDVPVGHGAVIDVLPSRRERAGLPFAHGARPALATTRSGRAGPISSPRPSGRRLDELTLDALRSGELDGDDLRATPETLRLPGGGRARRRPARAGRQPRARRRARARPLRRPARDLHGAQAAPLERAGARALGRAARGRVRAPR